MSILNFLYVSADSHLFYPRKINEKKLGFFEGTQWKKLCTIILVLFYLRFIKIHLIIRKQNTQKGPFLSSTYGLLRKLCHQYQHIYIYIYIVFCDRGKPGLRREVRSCTQKKYCYQLHFRPHTPVESYNYKKQVNPLKNQSSDPAKQRAGFYIKYNTGLKWVKGIYELFASLKNCSTVSPLANHKPAISVPKALKNLTSLHRETNPPDNYNMLHMLSNNTYTYQNVGKLNINWLSRQNSSRSIFETEP